MIVLLQRRDTTWYLLFQVCCLASCLVVQVVGHGWGVNTLVGGWWDEISAVISAWLCQETWYEGEGNQSKSVNACELKVSRGSMVTAQSCKPAGFIPESRTNCPATGEMKVIKSLPFVRYLILYPWKRLSISHSQE